MAVDISDIWRNVPPEEKFEMIARSHSRGVLAAFIGILLGATLAVGLQIPELLWAGCLLAPFVFQFASGKAWRDHRPRVLLEYLAARAVTRRYAFTVSAKDLGLRLIFKGVLEEEYSDEKIQEALNEAFENQRRLEVWVALFNDAVVIISERIGGARCELASPFNNKLAVEAVNPGKGDYTVGKTIILTLTDRTHVKRRYRLTSKYPAALVVFEKEIQSLLTAAIARQEAALSEPPKAKAIEDDDDDFSSISSF